MTQAVILAAGRGSRMKTLTQSQPKCLIKLAGKTLLEWQVSSLRKAGIEDIFVVGGYCSHLLKNRGCSVLLNLDWNQSNMVSSLYCAKDILSQKETIISYADIVYNSEVITQLMNSSKDISITYDVLWESLWQGRFDDPLEDVETFRVHEGMVTEIGAKPSDLKQVEGQYMGLLKVSSSGWNAICEFLGSISSERRRSLDMTTLLQNLISYEVPIGGVPISGRWCEVDRPEDLLYYEQKVHGVDFWTHDWRG